METFPLNIKGIVYFIKCSIIYLIKCKFALYKKKIFHQSKQRGVDMESVLHELRSAVLGGFNRQDVLEYIDRLTREQNQKIGALVTELETVQDERDYLSATLDSLRAESDDLLKQEAKARSCLEERDHNLIKMQEELQATRTQLAVARKELAELQNKMSQIEPIAKRYEALKDRVATVELDAHQKAQSTLDKAQAEVDALQSDTARWLGEIQETYDRLRAQVRECAQVSAQAEAAFSAMEEEYLSLLNRGLPHRQEDAP